MKYFSYVAIIFLACAFILFPMKSLASWAYEFVVWNGDVYVVSDEAIENVNKEIGHVTKYSDREGTYSGNFSNVYPKGTSYFSIEGVSTDEAIAIQGKDGTYMKANKDGEYAGNKYDFWNIIFSPFVAATSALLVLIGFYFYNKRRI
ncbi:hypothetical protein [Psychrobacillus sp.]|uniref:hypothetical protein n=1 Tax=Psychrobacillus sp. TaxID=1871623 RepID=UPI0028BF540B|nr:hypothetical protein [Psychrobacillus sp.]